MKKPKNRSENEIKVFISNRESKCDECGEELGRHAWIMLQGEKGAACLSCADLDHLVFLPSGDAALTRRSRKYSRLSALVLKWSRARKRYERQGLTGAGEVGIWPFLKDDRSTLTSTFWTYREGDSRRLGRHGII